MESSEHNYQIVIHSANVGPIELNISESCHVKDFFRAFILAYKQESVRPFKDIADQVKFLHRGRVFSLDTLNDPKETLLSMFGPTYEKKDIYAFFSNHEKNVEDVSTQIDDQNNYGLKMNPELNKSLDSLKHKKNNEGASNQERERGKLPPSQLLHALWHSQKTKCALGQYYQWYHGQIYDTYEDHFRNLNRENDINTNTEDEHQ